MLELVVGDLDFVRSRAREPSFDIWEEERGYHYYTQLVQAEALTRGAEWLEEAGDAVRALACRSSANELAPTLDSYWSAEDGYYRSRTGVIGGAPQKALDISLILGVLHAGRAKGAHSVLDPRAHATLTALEDLFDAEYPINRQRLPARDPAMGRYRTDVYYGGNPWYLATLAAAEFYFRLAIAMQSGAELVVTSENARFRRGLVAADGAQESGAFAAAAIECGDMFMRTVQAFTPASGDLSEHFDRTTGAQTSAKHLAWSYAAFLTAAASRRLAVRAIRG
jgi:glucoamylase